MAGWQDGRMAGWQDGRMAGWQDGRMMIGRQDAKMRGTGSRDDRFPSG